MFDNKNKNKHKKNQKQNKFREFVVFNENYSFSSNQESEILKNLPKNGCIVYSKELILFSQKIKDFHYIVLSNQDSEILIRHHVKKLSELVEFVLGNSPKEILEQTSQKLIHRLIQSYSILCSKFPLFLIDSKRVLHFHKKDKIIRNLELIYENNVKHVLLFFNDVLIYRFSRKTPIEHSNIINILIYINQILNLNENQNENQNNQNENQNENENEILNENQNQNNQNNQNNQRFSQINRQDLFLLKKSTLKNRSVVFHKKNQLLFVSIYKSNQVDILDFDQLNISVDLIKQKLQQPQITTEIAKNLQFAILNNRNKKSGNFYLGKNTKMEDCQELIKFSQNTLDSQENQTAILKRKNIYFYFQTWVQTQKRRRSSSQFIKPHLGFKSFRETQTLSKIFDEKIISKIQITSKSNYMEFYALFQDDNSQPNESEIQEYSKEIINLFQQ
ncbi:thisbe [Anaeramoeba ignava]|uniref:Thisbe n=1 Tax=Anaeramoeba ignava TaxID=1746090 RepID=A0A9Q0LXW5_ANAIG|nr:thisbe [Anaeramoeba ignava]